MCNSVAVVGLQWGDEGKGKIANTLARRALSVIRYNGGNNAGHQIVTPNGRVTVHLLPSGIVESACLCLIGGGVVVSLPDLADEIEVVQSVVDFDVMNNLRISDRATVVFKMHRLADSFSEQNAGSSAVGTTNKGIGPSYAARCLRYACKVYDVFGDWEAFVKKYMMQLSFFKRAFNITEYDHEQELNSLELLRGQFQNCIVDQMSFNSAMRIKDCGPITSSLLTTKWNFIIEGANAVMLDIGTGTYPFCTSSDTTVHGCGSGVGFSPRKLDVIIGVSKAYCTRVGNGGFPSEDHGSNGLHMQQNGREFGSTTGRPRRCGWLDVQALRYAIEINDVTALMITKLDVLTGLPEIKILERYRSKATGELLAPSVFPANIVTIDSEYEYCYGTYPGWEEDISGCKDFDLLPEPARNYILAIEQLTGVAVNLIGTGPSHDDLIERHT